MRVLAAQKVNQKDQTAEGSLLLKTLRGSNSLTLKASGFRRVDDGASVGQGRRSERQRVFGLVTASAVKIKSEEETFPCLRQTGESSSSFLTHAP